MITERMKELAKVKVEESSWSLPDTPAKMNRANKVVTDLERIKKEAYAVLGEDNLLDDIENAIDRAKQIIAHVKKGKK
jgi:hypothetical protein